MNDRPRRRVWPAVVAAQLGTLLAALDATIIGTAMPTVIAALDGVALYPWVFSANMLASTATGPIFGSLSDQLGRRRPFLAAIACFCAGSLVAGLASSMLVLVAGRVMQGIGAGGLLALPMVIFGDLFEGPRRARMMGWNTLVWGVASVGGPMLGGLLVDGWGWRGVFYLNLPVGALVAGLILLGLSETAPRHGGRRLDLAGALLFPFAVTLLLLGVLQPRGGAGAWELGAPARLATAAVGVGGLLLFVRVERAARDPLLAPGLFRDRPLATGALAAFFSGAAMFGVLVHVPILVQWGTGTDATTAGLSLMTMSAGWSVGSLVAGQLVGRVAAWPLPVAGMAAMTAGALALAVGAAETWGTLLAAGGMAGVGMGLTSLPLIVATQTLCRPEQRGVATAALLFARSIGATVGVASMGAVLTARLGSGVAGLGAGVLSPALAEALRAGMSRVFWVVTAAAALGLAATLAFPRDGAGTQRARVREEARG